MFVLGMDIGYSNLKVAFNNVNSHEPTVLTMPVGAGPKDYLPKDILGRKEQQGFIVNIDQEKFVVGVEPWRFSSSGWIRELHEDYPSTKNYRALFYASLLMTENKEIDLLVTGLPVSDYFDEFKKTQLENRLIGEHQVTDKIKILVKRTKVIPQPAGALIEIIEENEEFTELFTNCNVLIFDVGFYSVDWLLVKNNEPLKQYSGTSIFATSKLLQKAGELIAEKYGRTPKIDDLESLIRNGSNHIIIFGEKVKINPFIEMAATTVSDIVGKEVRQSIRSQEIDIILLTGGGAIFYEKIIKNNFPKTKIYRSKNSVEANAKGYWYYGRAIL